MGMVSGRAGELFAPDLALFAARLVLLVGRASALRLIRFRLLALLGWFVFALGHCPLLFDCEWSSNATRNPAVSSLRHPVGHSKGPQCFSALAGLSMRLAPDATFRSAV